MLSPRITEHLSAQHRDDLMREARQARLAHEATAGVESPSRHMPRGVGRRLLALVRRAPVGAEATPAAARPVSSAVLR